MPDYPFQHLVGDIVEVLKGYPDNHFDGVLCDPPYGLSDDPDMEAVLRAWLDGEDYRGGGKGFMGKSWDAFVPGPEVWREVKRVVKPGGYVVAASGTRTFDILGLALRLAGLERRDTVASWIYGSGFPKSRRVSNDLDNAAGVEREVVGSYQGASNIGKGGDGKLGYRPGSAYPTVDRTTSLTAPATDEAKTFDGYGSALKPAWEPWIITRVPLKRVTRDELRTLTGRRY